MWKLLREDAARWLIPGEIGDPASIGVVRWLTLLLTHLPLRAIAWYRLAEGCRQRRVPFVYALVRHHLFHAYGLELWAPGGLGGGFYLPHPHGCVVAADRIGRNCSIIAAATLGMRRERGFPVLADEVFVGAGARVLGPVSIGAQAAIGANAVVLHDVPPGATAVGVPARIVRKPDRLTTLDQIAVMPRAMEHGCA
jgi:serine O-acetyltransferase